MPILLLLLTGGAVAATVATASPIALGALVVLAALLLRGLGRRVGARRALLVGAVLLLIVSPSAAQALQRTGVLDLLVAVGVTGGSAWLLGGRYLLRR